MQKILIVFTEKEDLRSEIFGRTFQDGNAVMEALTSNMKTFDDLPVGDIAWESVSRRINYHYPTVLHAIGDGWKLLTPPKSFETTRMTCEGSDEHNLEPTYAEVEQFEWWLVRD